MNAQEMLDALIAAAAKHGEESDPDHEVGDLQDILRACWERLTPRQRREVWGETSAALLDWLPEVQL